MLCSQLPLLILPLGASVSAPWSLSDQSTASPTLQVETAQVSLHDATLTGAGTHIHFEEIYPDEPFLLAIEILNDTEHEAQLTNVVSGCSCTIGELPSETLSPGDRSPLLLHLNLENREGTYEQAVAVEMQLGSQHHILTLFISLELQRDVALSRPTTTVFYRSSDITDTDVGPVRSQPVHLLCDSEITNLGPVSFEITPLVHPPPGAAIRVLDRDGGAGLSPFSVEISAQDLPNTPRDFDLPLCIDLHDEEAATIASVRRNLHVQIRSELSLRTSPPDTFLGLFETSELPHRTIFFLHTDPEIIFQLSPSGALADGLEWVAEPVSDAEFCESWTLTISIPPTAQLGSHMHRLPLQMICRDLTGDWPQQFDLELSYVVLP